MQALRSSTLSAVQQAPSDPSSTPADPATTSRTRDIQEQAALRVA